MEWTGPSSRRNGPLVVVAVAFAAVASIGLTFPAASRAVTGPVTATASPSASVCFAAAGDSWACDGRLPGN